MARHVGIGRGHGDLLGLPEFLDQLDAQGGKLRCADVLAHVRPQQAVRDDAALLRLEKLAPGHSAGGLKPEIIDVHQIAAAAAVHQIQVMNARGAHHRAAEGLPRVPAARALHLAFPRQRAVRGVQADFDDAARAAAGGAHRKGAGGVSKIKAEIGRPIAAVDIARVAAALAGHGHALGVVPAFTLDDLIGGAQRRGRF